MIFYFSGTGNSLFVAEKIAQHHNERLVSIAAEMNNEEHRFEYHLDEDEIVGFVYPVHSWKAPQMVMDFIAKLKPDNYKKHYIFSVCTCGDDEGYTTPVLEKALKDKGLTLNSGFTMPMPNNYIFAFDIDSVETQQEKLKNADRLLVEINSVIDQRQDGVFKLRRGRLPYIKTYIINPLFQRYAMNTKKFYATDDCTICGLCAEVCNTKNIIVKDKPAWGKHCTQCLACIHRCPARAVQYGKSTLKKGRYVHPIIK